MCKKKIAHKIQADPKCQETLQELLARQRAAEVTSFSNLLITLLHFSRQGIKCHDDIFRFS